MTDRERDFIESGKLTREDIYITFGLTAAEIERCELAESVRRADQVLRDRYWEHILKLAREIDASP